MIVIITTTLGKFGWILMEILFKLMEGAFYMMKIQVLIIGMVNIKMALLTFIITKDLLG